MKVSPRFTVRMLLVITTIVAGGFWWGKWPERTAQRFILNCGLSSDANSRLSSDQVPTGDLNGFSQMVRRNSRAVRIEFQAGTFADVVYGRRTVVVTGERGRYRFWVERGAIVAGPTPAFIYGGQEFILDVF